MNAIPWYRSPVIISAVTSILTQLAARFGVAEAIPQETIQSFVDALFEIVSVLALVWTIVARVRSPAQPVTLTKAAAEAKQSGFTRPLMLAFLLALSVPAVSLLHGCAVAGLTAPKTFEDRLGYAYGQNTALRAASTRALSLKLITSADAQHILTINDQARQILDLSKAALVVGDVQTAEGRLLMVTGILTELETYLTKNGQKVQP